MAHPRRFRFGVGGHATGTAAEWRALAQKVEVLGYSTLVLPDHFNDLPAPIPTLAAAAAVTTDLRIGQLVACNEFKHPVVQAKEVATLDVLSDGRFEWGIGAGWLPADFETSGVPFDPPGERVSRMIESIAVMKALFAEAPATHAGEHFHVTGLDGRPKPVQRPHPPLLVGGAGRRMLRFAARHADIVGVAPGMASLSIMGQPPRLTPVEAVDEQVGWMRDAAGGRYDDLELNMTVFPVVITDKPQEHAERIAKAMNRDPEQILRAPHTWIGPLSAIEDAIEEWRARWGVSYFVVPENAAEKLAPLIEARTGH